MNKEDIIDQIKIIGEGLGYIFIGMPSAILGMFWDEIKDAWDKI